MLNKIKSNIHTADLTNGMEKSTVRNLGLINHAAANASQTIQTSSLERRLRRDRRNHRNAFSTLGMWRASIG